MNADNLSEPLALAEQEMGGADVSVIIVSYNTETLLPVSLKALREAASGCTVQIIIVDNASRDGSVAMIRRDFPDCELIANTVNVGFGRACNQALSRAHGRFILLLNTDAFVSPDSLSKTLAYMDAHPRCGILGVRLVDQNGKLQPSARSFLTPWSLFVRRMGLRRWFPWLPAAEDLSEERHASIQHCDWVPGCFYLIRRQVIEDVGLFDPRFFLYFEEVDHCLAAKRASWEVTYFPHTTVFHIGGESARSEGKVTAHSQLEEIQVESELLYFRKNGGLVAAMGNVLLMTLADLADMVRCAKGGKPSGTFATILRHLRLEWSLLWRTRWGLRPTR